MKATERCAHELFEAQVDLTPELAALEFEGTRLTYRELQARANRLAHRLLEHCRGPETLVGVYLRRGPDAVVSILAILKAGAAYLPLDPDYPKDLLGFMLEEAAPSVVVTESRLAARLPGHNLRLILVDDARSVPAEHAYDDVAVEVDPGALAYVIYTSGSTGRPKGVMVEHRSLARHLLGMRALIGIDSADRVLEFASFSLDVSLEQTLTPLIAGATTVLRGPDLWSAGELLENLLRLRLTVVDLPSAYCRHVLQEIGARSFPLHDTALRAIVVGGDVMSMDPVEEFLDRWGTKVRVLNAYGPTEATITATVQDLSEPTCLGRDRAPIGHPVPATGTRIQLLDDRLEPVSPGAVGEIYIDGPRLARGYLRRPRPTALQFLPDPRAGSPGSRLYRTGDFGRLLPDGTLEFVGREDEQVKIRGFRVELGQVEQAIIGHPLVKSVAVVVAGDDEASRHIMAYAVPERSDILAPTQLRQYVQDRVPEHMVPASIMMLDELPLTPQGKVDRKALLRRPAPETPARVHSVPRTNLEREVATIWSEVLGAPLIGMNDNFFELGGDSLKAMEALARQERQGIKGVSLGDLLRAPTVRDACRSAFREPPEPHSRPRPDGATVTATGDEAWEAHGRLPLSAGQESVWFIEQLGASELPYNFQDLVRMTGPVDVAVLHKALQAIIDRHEAFRTSFHEDNGTPYQQVHPSCLANFNALNFSGLEPSRAAAELQIVLDAEVATRFDRTRPPLVKWTFVTMSSTSHCLIHVEHHLVHDGWSYRRLLRQLMELYQALSSGAARLDGQVDPPYSRFVLWQRQWLTSTDADRQRSYWANRLKDPPTPLDLGGARDRPKIQRFAGRTEMLRLPREIVEALTAAARHHRKSLFSVMLAAFALLIKQQTGRTEFCIGTGMANRRAVPDAEAIMGMLVNAVVLRLDLRGAMNFQEVLQHVTAVTTEALDNQEYPFELVVRDIQAPRSLSHNPLFQVAFAFHDAPMGDLRAQGISLHPDEGLLQNGSAKFDLNVVVIPKVTSSDGGEEMRILWEYNTVLFSAEHMTGLAERYERSVLDVARHGEPTSLL